MIHVDKLRSRWAHACGLTLACAPLLLAGCGASYIPNTDVEDSDENRDVVAFCELYRKAVERKDVAVLMQMASSEYYEDGGNLDASDDIDYAGLKAYLSDKFEDANNIRYEIRYRRVRRQESGVIFVDFTYSGSFRVASDAGEKWRSVVEENRLELVPEGDGYRVISGM